MNLCALLLLCPTTQPLPFKTWLLEEEVVFGWPLVVEHRPTGGYRSTFDLQTSVLFQFGDESLPELNGGKVGVRFRF